MERVDDVGAILLASNITTTCCDKHVVIRYEYVNEMVEERMVMIVFVTSADNDRDILKKT